ncbi:MAG: patatin-like phospholipase family protein [Candidatus Methylomirabilales bacterium]
MAYHFRNLVFEGGGVKGIAYVGAMEVLAKKGILKNVLRAGGTSAGAINALLLGLNFSPAETKEILALLDFRSFLDDSWGIARDTTRLIQEFGWYKGDYFRDWVGRLVKEKTGNPNATFNDVHGRKQKRGFRDMYFIGTNLSTRFAEVFSYEHTPRMCVADAVRISMSIPLFFASKRSQRGDVYVDGGVLDNYPVKLFDRAKYLEKTRAKRDVMVPEYYRTHNQRLKTEGKEISPYVYNKQTLGFRLDAAKEIAVFRDQAEPEHRLIEDFFSYAWALVETVMESQASMHLHSDDWQRTIYVDTLGVKTTEFDLSDAQKEALVESGRVNTEKYFAWYDNPKSRPVNRP